MTIKADPASINAIVSAMGALALCVSRQLNDEQRASFSNDLARLAAQAEMNGDTLLETLLIDMHQVSR